MYGLFRTRTCAALGAVLAGAAFAALPGPAHAAAGLVRVAHPDLPTSGQISYVSGGNLVVAKADGSDPVVVAHGVTGPAAWLPDGSRLLYIASGDVWSVQPDGHGAAELTATGQATSVAVDGTGVVAAFTATAVGDGYSSGTLVHEMYASARAQNPGDNDSYGDEEHVAFVPMPSTGDDIVMYDLDDQGPDEVYGQAQSAPFPIIAGSEASVSAAATQIAVIRPDSAGTEQVFVAPLTAGLDPGTDQITASAGTAGQITTGATDASEPHFSPDGTQIVYSVGGAVQIMSIAGTPVRTIPNATDPSWQPVLANTVDRVYGGNAIETGIAASKTDYASVGASGDSRAQAQAVVLSRSDGYWDALAGSAFADVVRGPLLITPPSDLDSGVLQEIKRILPKGGEVYLLGGLQALSPKVQDQLTAAGYATQRFAGTDMYDTAVQVDEMSEQIEGWQGQPDSVIIATGAQYYDALAAGAAAGSVGASVVVLTDGTKMPAASAAYLNTLNPLTEGSASPGQVAVYTAGGPGTKAFTTALADHQLWPDYSPQLTIRYWTFVGADAEDTALDLANYFGGGTQRVAVATMNGWYDALTGGAMIGAQGGMLLLTPPTSLYAGDAAFLNQHSGSIGTVDVLGGYQALPATLDPQIGAQIGLPGTAVLTTGQPQLAMPTHPAGPAEPAEPGTGVGGLGR